MIYLIFREFVSKNFWRGGPKKSKPPQGPPTPDPLGSDPFIYQSIALNLRIPNIQFSMGLTRDVQKLCSLGPPAPHVLQPGFLKRLLGVKKSAATHCVLRKTGQMPIFFYWFRCIIRFWNSLLSSNNPLLEKVVQADLLLIANRSDTGLIRFCTHSKISLRLRIF